MRKLVLTFDLDDTIFDASWIFRDAWCKAFLNKKDKPDFVYPSIWNYHDDPNWKGDPAACLDDEFMAVDRLTLTTLDDKNVAVMLNNIIHNPMFEVYFITKRPLYMDTYKQIEFNDIEIDRDHVITTDMKVEAIEFVNSDLHFDDAPHILDEVKTAKVIISNDKTLYNHKWVDEHPDVPHYTNIRVALKNLKSILEQYGLK